MPSEPVPADPGRSESQPGWEPVITRPDPMAEEEWQAWCEATAAQDEPFDPEEWLDPDGPPPPGEDQLTPGELAEIREVMDGQVRADAAAARLGTSGALGVIAASAGRRGPGQPGSAQIFPGEHAGPAALFAAGLLFDSMPGRPELAQFADAAAGADDSFQGVSDDQLLGVLCAWERLESHMAARKCAAAAELIRRRPAKDCAAEGPARMPRAWDEFTAAELGAVLAASRHDADAMLDLAHDLEVKLPGTKAAFLDGVVNQDKAEIIARAAAVLDAKEARAAEALVLDRAGRLTPGGLRSAIARAVIEVAPDKARKRREQAAREARVERWAQASGNAALAGLELPPAQVFAADQKISALARQLKQAGLAGSMDQLRAQAYLDLLLGTDSRPCPGQDTAIPAAAPPGFAGKVTLTIPLATLMDRGTLSATAALNPNPGTTIGIVRNIVNSGHAMARHLPSQLQTSPARRVATGPGGCAPGETSRT